ncbi:MAG: InlB B-repeat-containing protein, partial [Bacteroidaceae bacterium]|nr:InlB B-repeat-containing protein [Bacteroidaceae bacterium]
MTSTSTQRKMQRFLLPIFTFLLFFGAMNVATPVMAQHGGTSQTYQTRTIQKQIPQANFKVVGQMPAQAQVQATKVQRTMPQGKQVKGAYDITIKNGNANWQPQQGQPVMVSITDPNFTDGEALDVYHEGANGNEFVATVSPTNHTITFPARSFSVYIVTESGGDARLAVTFVQAGGETTTIMVKPNDIDPNDPDDTLFKQIVYDPGAGTYDHTQLVFRGWHKDVKNYTYTVNDASTSMTIAGVRDEVKSVLNNGVHEGDTIYFYALIYKSFTITYLDDMGTVLSSENFLELTNVTQRSYHVLQNFDLDDQHTLLGWYVDDGYESSVVGHQTGRLYKNDTNIVIKGDVVFNPYLPQGYWLVFDENGKGGTYNAPQFVLGNDVTHKPCDDEHMTRYGYTFGGWYQEATCVNTFAFGQPLTASDTAYAKWIAASTANYTVMIWLQNISGDGYDFKESVQLSGNVGSTINTVQQQGTGNDAYAQVNGVNKQYTGFHLKEFTQDVTIKTEGNSVVNVYYDRTEYTLTFVPNPSYNQVNNPSTSDQHLFGRINVGSNWNPSYVYVKLTWNGNRWYYSRGGQTTQYSNNGPFYHLSYNSNTVPKITALYGQSIAERFPISGYNNYSWTAEYSNIFSTSAKMAFLDVMPAENTVFIGGETSGNNSFPFRYYVEALPTDENTVTYNNKQYTLYTSYVYLSSSDGLWSTFEEDFVNLLGFERETSNPEFDVWGTEGKTEQLTPGTGLNAGISFYYTRKKYTISYLDGKYVDGNNNEMSENMMSGFGTSALIAYNADVSSYNKDSADYYVPTTQNEGFVFEGWYIDDDCQHEYTFDKMPEGGIIVYAKWRQIQYRVFLHPKAGEDPTLSWGSETQAMNFRISYNGTLSVPTGKRTGYEWVGWYSDTARTVVFSSNTHFNDSYEFLADYHKNTDMTDPMNKWGITSGDTIFCSDTLVQFSNGVWKGNDRPWITQKIDLYGKWRKIVQGANGIGIQYVCGTGENCPGHNKLYLDNTTAIAESAPTAPEDSVFSHWVLQRYDTTLHRYVPTDTNVFPGGDFTVLIDMSRFTDDPDTAYMIQLKAAYILKEKETNTFITWYKNDGSVGDGAIVRKDEGLNINQAVSIPTPGQRAGYIFKGWYKLNIENDADVEANLADYDPWDSDWDDTCNANFLYYNTDSLYYFSTPTYTAGTRADSVAADEANPYDYLYAIWEPIVDTVDFARVYCKGSTPVALPTATAAGVTTTWTYNNQTVTEINTDEVVNEAVYTFSTNSCERDTIHITIKDAPTVNLLAETPLTVENDTIKVCQQAAGSTTTITASVTGAQGTVTYLWDDDPELSTNAINVPTAAADTITHTVVVEDGRACPVTKTITVVVKPVAEATITPETVAICAGQSATLSVDNVEGATYVWVKDDVTIDTAHSSQLIISETAEENGTYLYEVTVTMPASEGGCVSHGEREVTVKPVVMITAEPQTYTYNGSEQGPAGTYTEDFDTYVTISGLQTGDAITSITLTGSKTNADTYTNEIIPSAVEIKNAAGDVVTSNYCVEYVEANLVITCATATVTAVNNTKVYGAQDPTLTATVTGLQNGDAESVISYTLA